MLYYATKIIVSAPLIVAISEIAKRSTGLAASRCCPCCAAWELQRFKN